MMSRAIIIFIAFFTMGMSLNIESQEDTRYFVLAIEYVGPSDKPVTPIVISDSEAGAAWYRNAVMKRDKSELTYVHTIGGPLLKRLIAVVEASKDNVQQKGQNNSTPSKTVSVAVVTPSANNTVIYDTDSAISLLDRLQESCDKSESLRSDLVHFRDRIRAWK